MENMDMNFSLNGLDEILRGAEKKEDDGLNEILKEAEALKMQREDSPKKMENFTRIVKGVAKKYASKWVDREDLEQTLWVRVLELINDCGGIEYTDESLVARVCWNRSVDKYKYDRRRYESKAEYIEGTEEKYDNGSLGTTYFEALKSDKFLKGYDLVLIKEVIDLFDIGSRKRKYAVMKLVNYGVLNVLDLDPWDRALVEIPKTEDEEGYIHCLGYKSHCPGSWTCQKREMKEAILKFLGLDR